MGNLDTPEGRDSYPIIQSMIPWTEKLYDMTDEEIEEYKAAYKEEYHNDEEKQKNKREVIDCFYIEYQYFQVRKTYQWVMEQYALSGDKMAIRREILMQRLRGSTECPIDPEDIEYFISNMKKSTIDLLICKKWLFKIYEHGASQINGYEKELDANIPYLVGVDPASGGGGDNFAITIVNPLNLKIAAEFKSPYINGPNAYRMLLELVQEHIPKACLIIERNSMGVYLIQALMESPIRDNLYWHRSKNIIEDISSEDPGDRELIALSETHKKYGNYLVKKVRDAMFELLFQHIDQCKDLLLTEYLVNDMCKLVRTSTGRIEASKGEHDDCLFSYMHAIYIYYTGDNLETFGIFPSFNPIPGVTDGITPIDDSKQTIDAITATGTEVKESFDDYLIRDAERMESEIKEMAESLSFIDDPRYKYIPPNERENATVNIGASFFESINGFY